MDKLYFEEGLEEAIERIESIEERPILVAVYGWPDSGKSYLINKLGDCFAQRGLEVARSSGGPYKDTFYILRERAQYLRRLIFFHCAWVKENKGERSLFKNEDPNYLAESIAGKKIHLNIGIYNPFLFPKPTGEYDLIIRNPESKKKSLQCC
ncbi:MAG: hypothetical protein ABIA37_01085 [Candidatus Woesearchaeota archaeon]